ncbi:MAG: CRISPR-associated endonuclease Cas1, partial [Hyphomicrobiaceae bacterium]
PPNHLPGDSFSFEGRRRRPPPDAVNCLLSYCYSLLTKDCAATLLTVGFDPLLGFLHRPRFGRPALALDLAEEFRPLIAESTVITVVNNGEVTPSDFVVNPGTSRQRVLGNTDFVVADPGDVIHIHSPGGGGRGDPFEREAERVLVDVERGYVSLQAARRDYGVVIEDGNVNAAATARLRASKPDNGGAFFDFGPEREAFEAVWSREAYAELGRILELLPPHWRAFVKTKVFDLMAKEGEGSAEDRVRAAYADARRLYPAIPDVANGN